MAPDGVMCVLLKKASHVRSRTATVSFTDATAACHSSSHRFSSLLTNSPACRSIESRSSGLVLYRDSARCTLLMGPAFLRVLWRVYRRVAWSTTGVHAVTEAISWPVSNLAAAGREIEAIAALLKGRSSVCSRDRDCSGRTCGVEEPLGDCASVRLLRGSGRRRRSAPASADDRDIRCHELLRQI